MTALEALNLAAPLADTYNSVEQRLLVSIARQLSLNDDHQLNEVSKWQIKRLANLGMLRKDAARIIAAGTKGVPSDFADTVQQAITSALAEDGMTDMWKNEGFAESAKNAVKHYRNQAKDVYNQVNTVMKYKAESSFVSAINSVADKWNADMRRQQAEIADKQGFLDILNSNTADVVNGSAARTKAVRTTIHEMAQKGIPAFVDRSGREWSPEAYVNMDIRATVKNTALEAKFSVMDSLGQDVFEVSSHPGSRPKCRPWQGKLISRSGKTTEITDLHGRKHKVIPLSQTSFGEPDGLFGINCGHRPRGCSEGVFTKSAVEYDDEEDKELYNKVCRQRELERKVRKSKTEADMLEAAGDTEGAKEVRRRMAEQNKALRAYCEDNGLKYRSDRVRTYGSVKPITRPNPAPIPDVTFGGVACKVQEKQFSFGNKSSIYTPSNVEAVVYTTPDGTNFVFPKQYDSTHLTITPEQAICCWQRVPVKIRAMAQKTVEFVDFYNPEDSYWKAVYNNFTQSYATGGDKITFYRYDQPHDLDYVTRTYCHEAGHYIDKQLSKSGKRFSEESQWQQAMFADAQLSGMKSPTIYGENAPAEDFAESIAEYVNNPLEFAKNFPNRSSILQNIVL